jgi:hypothetical protein
MNVRRLVREAQAPDEAGAQARAWSVVSSAFQSRAVFTPAASRRRLLVAPAVAVLLGALLLSPAGASVRRWISQALGAPHPAPALLSLPAPGRLLVSGTGGSWTVAADGAARRLGSWPLATWSPHGLYEAVAERDELAAVDPHGTVRWALARPSVSDPTWYGPSGFRVAYLSGAELRVVAGDGTGDHVLASEVAAVPPAWESGHPYRLAYATAAGRVIVRDADSGRVIWSVTPVAQSIALSWSADGTELLVVASRQISIYNAHGRLVSTLPAHTGAPIRAASLAPDGRELAIIAGASSQDVSLVGLVGGSVRRVLSGPGLSALAWSPDRHWLVVSWPAADQWVFVRVVGSPRIVAVSRIRRQFGGRGFPRLDGWCCVPAS